MNRAGIMDSDGICAICGRPADDTLPTDLGGVRLVKHYRCDTCGDFEVPGLVLAMRKPIAPEGEAHRLSAFTRARKLRGADAPLFLVSIEETETPPPQAVLISDALAAFPPSVADRLDRT